MKNKLLDIIDFEKINVLLEAYNKSTGFVTAILDREGNVLSKSGWRQICTEFHRVNPKTAQKCMVSDTELANKMESGEKYHFYKCLNGLVDVAIPIVIKGEHIANLFTGQFFFEKPDAGFFKAQAKKYGFNENIYLDALAKVPVISEEKVKIAMDFLLKMTELIAEMSFQRVEQIELNNALTKSEKRHHLLINNMLEAVAYHQVIFENGKAIDTILLQANDAFTKQTGLENVVGKNLSEIIPNIYKNSPEIIERFERVAVTGQSEQYEAHIEELNSWYITSLYGLQNNIVVSVFNNITERKVAQLNLEKNTKLLNDLMEYSSSLIYMFDTKGNIISANRQFQNLFKKTRDEIIGKNRSELMPNFIANQHYTNDLQIIKNRIPSSFEEENIESDGMHYYLTTKFPLFDGQNYIYGVAGISTDITERKLAEIGLLESKSFFEQLFIQSSTSTQLLDKDGWCIHINPKLSELFGVKPEDIEGKKYNILQDGEIIRTGVINHLKKVFEQKETVRWVVNFDIEFASESTGVHVSKPEKRWFQNLAYPILNAEGKLIYVIVQHEDITGRKQAEEEVIKINRELEKRVQERTLELQNSQAALLNIVEDLNEKTEELKNSTKLLKLKNKELETFTYSVSHDLKAPLRGIDGYSRLLEDNYLNSLDGEGRHFIKTIREGTKQMNQLIEDLLAYSRLERTSTRITWIDIKPLIENVLLFFKTELNDKEIKAETDVEDCKILADHDGLTIALRNLVDNAIKFSEKTKPPLLRIVLKENVYSWTISVEDNGIGFDPKYKLRIFEIFQRLNLPENYPGTGIGLAMVNKTMERMGGKVWAVSSPEKGSTFFLEFPKQKKT